MADPLAAARSPRILPGFRFTLGLTMGWLGLVVLLPLGGLFVKVGGMGAAPFLATVLQPRVLAALRLSFGAALGAAAVNAVFGLLLAWVLVRWRFPGRRLVDAIIDVPFALPTAVAGIALSALYAENGWIGSLLAKVGITIAFTPVGVLVALVFIGLPFVVRTVQPVLADFEAEVEEAAATLGAGQFTIFLRVILPAIAPAVATGFALAFARGLGEYGSVIFIAGNLPMVSEIAPLLIVIRLEEFDYNGATAIAVAMLLASFALLLAINLLQRWAEAARR
jgi:sulfate transport system permease protein